MRRMWGANIYITHFHQHHHHFSFTSHGYVLIYNNATSSFLHQASEAGVLGEAEWLLLLLEEGSQEALEAQVSTLDAFIDSELMFVTQHNCSAHIKSVYRVGPKQREARVEVVGTWSKEGGFTPSPLAKLDRRKDFKGYPMTGVGVKVFDFFTTYLSSGGVSGFVGDIVTTLQRTHNFTMRYEVLEGYAYGKLESGSNTRWTGMVGALQEGRADLTVSELSIIQERSEVISYTQPLYIVSRRLFVATHVDFSKKLLAYASPMDTLLYITIFGNMVGLAFILYFIERLSLHFIPIKKEADSWSLVSWYMTSAFLQQGCSTCPSYMASRIIFWVGFIVSLIVFTSYSATLVSHLAVERPATLPFSTLQQLSRQTGWDAGVNNNDLFQVTATQTCAGSVSEECRVLQEVWNRIIMRSPDNIVDSYRQGIQKVLKEKYVFIGVDVTTNYYIRELSPEDGCRVKELPGRYLTGGVAIGLQQKSPFRSIFDSSIQRMREAGLMSKLIKEWLSADRSCTLDTEISASITDVAIIFFLLMGGATVSCILLTAEIMMSWMKKHGIKPEAHPLTITGRPAWDKHTRKNQGIVAAFTQLQHVFRKSETINTQERLYENKY
ncbi:hypothetical protein Pmani_007770 [Petrolisthes manimaculis]|uniref:Ionotropic glutamate receptor C-terminal domain-containing protein n=1 Tax=Petrolisthes manimaculis TaxID=1843537 RepID=A0AAE1Q894_9EUCA|nr:hypothetical protein Pmani_007770 [Petrolisthes manimaculis]